MKKTATVIAVFLIAIVGVTAFSFGGRWLGLQMEKFFAPKEEEVRREVYEESRTNTRGVIEDLKRLRYKYEKSDSHKGSLRSLILQKAREVPKDNLPPELRRWVERLRDQNNSFSTN